jgi:hypothetical protein
MTTNGLLLDKLAQPLAEAGLEAGRRRRRYPGRPKIFRRIQRAGGDGEE